MVDRVSPLPHDNNDDSSDNESFRVNVAYDNEHSANSRDAMPSIAHCRSISAIPNRTKSKKKSVKPRVAPANKTNFNYKSRSRTSAQKNWTKPQSYAALDLGTNNCRLLIARPNKDGFTVIDAFSRVVRLGEGLAKSGKISNEAMDRAIDALAICAQKLKRRNVTLSRSVATEACRQADNGEQFIERVYQETGILLDIISSEEEARLAVLGCHILLDEGQGPALIFDIGGGSTELALVSTESASPIILEWISIPWGVVTLTESEPCVQDNEPARIQAYNNMRNRVRDSFHDFGKKLPKEGSFRTLGTSGTITTLASVFLELPYYNRNKIDGITVPADAMRYISRELAKKSPDERSLEPCIGKHRSDLVIAGCAILESILDIWPAQTLGVADRGIREGILRALMKNDGSVSMRSKQ